MANEAAARAGAALRDIPDAVQWHEGMLLSPQHFQQQNARFEGLLQAAALEQNPYAWGLSWLRLDLGTLPAGLFRVRQVEAVLPDGAAVWYDAAEETGEASLEIDLAGAAKAFPDQALTIFLGVALRTAEAARGEFARYRSLPGATVVDENTGDGGMEIPRLRPRLRLFAGAAPPASYIAMPIARVGKHDDAFILGDYVAPATRVGFDSPLHAACASVAQLLRSKALHLAEQVRAPSVAGLSMVVWESKRQIQCLAGGLPGLEALLGTGQAHPFALYLALCGVAGQVTGLAASLQPPLLAPYRHDELAASFAPVRDFILRAVEEGVSDNYLALALERREGAFVTMFDGRWAGRRLVIGIRRPAGASESDMAGWGQQCLIGSDEVLPSLRERRTLGLRRRLLAAGDELGARDGVVLLELATDPAVLKPDRLLRIENPGGSATAEPAEIVLYVKNQEL